jgi:hypothetical protein
MHAGRVHECQEGRHCGRPCNQSQRRARTLRSTQRTREWGAFKDAKAGARAQEAEAAERSDPPMLATCRALVGVAVALGVEAEDRSRTWKADAEEALKRGRRAGPAARALPGAETTTLHRDHATRGAPDVHRSLMERLAAASGGAAPAHGSAGRRGGRRRA